MRKLSAVPALLVAGAVVFSAQAVAGQDASVESEIATSIVDRMPEGTGNEFPLDVGEVYVWTRVMNAGGTSIQHIWIHDGQEYPVSLAIGGSPWRTWSSKVIPPEWAGTWTVEVRGADGAVLDTMEFTVG